MGTGGNRWEPVGTRWELGGNQVGTPVGTVVGTLCKPDVTWRQHGRTSVGTSCVSGGNSVGT